LKKFLSLLIFINFSCNTGNLTVIADLPSTLDEVSGIEILPNSKLLWMLNDGKNPSEIYGLNPKGKIKKVIKINAKNHDWEELTSDKKGNIYIGDFGNNLNKRKNLSILKVNKDSLNNKGKIDIERITFHYPNQKKFPPKQSKMHFDCEAFFHYNDSLYLFTKSREKNKYGKTNLYKIPATQGDYEAQFIASFKTCNELPCWITAADINDDNTQVALLTLDAAWIFTEFSGDNFFSGTSTKYAFNFNSQKEGLCFKNDSTLYITDERTYGRGRNLYEFKLN